MAAKYPQIKVTAEPSDTALTLLKKAQDAFQAARAAGASFGSDNPREVAMVLFNLDPETMDPKLVNKYKSTGIPRSVYAPGGNPFPVATMKANLAEWITVEEAA